MLGLLEYMQMLAAKLVMRDDNMTSSAFLQLISFAFID